MTIGRPSASARDNPIIMLSYAYSGAPRVQEWLAAGTELACTAGTGILPLCGVATEVWRTVEGDRVQHMSALAANSVRAMLTAQVAMLLASTGKTRWCELAMADPADADTFCEVFPGAIFLCVHRRCTDVIREGVATNPWGLQAMQLRRYLSLYPGNSVAALAAYWANSTEQLLSFEEAHQQVTRRIRYEDATGDGMPLGELRAWLRLDSRPEQPGAPDAPDDTSLVEPEVPVEMIPLPLRQRVMESSARLGYRSSS